MAEADNNNTSGAYQIEVIESVANAYNDVCTKKLELLNSSVCFYEPKPPHKPYFLLINPERKDKPLRLYRSSMLKLAEHLPKAIAKVDQVRKEYPGDNILYEIAIVNQRKENYVRLVVQTYNNEGYIYVRLFNKKDGVLSPTKFGVRIIYEDDLEKFNSFVAECK